MSSFVEGSRGIDRRRVGLLLRRALDSLTRKSPGDMWIQGDLRMEMDYGVVHCAAGAIRDVPGFSEEERVEAEAALAKLIAKSDESGKFTRFLDDDVDFRSEWVREEVIFGTNDDPHTTFKKIRGLFERTAALFGK